MVGGTYHSILLYVFVSYSLGDTDYFWDLRTISTLATQDILGVSTVTLFYCNDSANTTIDERWICDNEPDCTNGMDEHLSTCNKTKCEDHEYECGTSGICILAAWRCEGETDCPNGEDEMQCDDVDYYDYDVTCSEDSWKCKSDSTQCIDRYSLCDGVHDCTDRSDESKETCEDSVQCFGDYMACFDPTSCIPSQWRCDGGEDCSDGSDEIGCDGDEGLNHTCSMGEIACRNASNHNKCVSIISQCDGIYDCLNGEDEEGECSKLCEQVEGGTENTCGQKCKETPSGPVCSCNEGYRLSGDSETCDDMDECSLPSNQCQQICVNTVGSYQCQCVAGYGLTSDKQRCKPYGHNSTYLFFGTHNQVRRMMLLPLVEGAHDTKPYLHYDAITNVNITPDSIVTDVDYLYETETVFWLESTNKTTMIKSKSESGKVMTLVESNSSLVLQRISIDWIGRNVYFTATGKPKETDKSGCSTCGRIGLVPITNSSDNAASSEAIHGIADNLGNVLDIIAISDIGIVIACEYDVLGRIFAVAADGSDLKNLKLHLMWPNALTYDTTADTLYWSQLPTGHWANREQDFEVRSITLATLANEKVVLSRSHPYYRSSSSIAYFENRIRWYDVLRDEIISAEAWDGKNPVVLAKLARSNASSHEAKSLVISHPMLQRIPPQYSTICNTLNCDHACVMTNPDVKSLTKSETMLPQCVCPDTKYLFSLTSSCKVHGKYQFIIIDDGYLRTVHGYGSQSRVRIEDGTASAYAMVYDANKERIYFVDREKRSIRYIKYDAPNPKSVTFIENIEPTRYITIDPTTGTLYWISNCTIIAAKTFQDAEGRSSTIQSTIFMKDVDCPLGLAFDHHRHKLYFTIITPSASLYSMNADGTDLRMLRSVAATQTLSHMVFDPYSDRVVYIAKTYTGRDYIETVELNSNSFFVSVAFTKDATAIAVTSNRVAVFEPTKGRLITQTKSRVGAVQRADTPLEAWNTEVNVQNRGGMTLVDASHTFGNASNPCSPYSAAQASCVQFCFPSTTHPEQYTCGCQDGYVLAADGFSCFATPCEKDELYCYQYNVTGERDEHFHRWDHLFSDCVSLNFACDRRNADCYDGSDESVELCGCQEPMFKECRLPGDNTTANRQCLDSDLFCNGFVECVNGADEINCSCDPVTEFKCPPIDSDARPNCIPIIWVDDGVADCAGGEDESNLECGEQEFKCEDPAECISSSLVCDDYYDCHDGSDEFVNCTGEAEPPNSTDRLPDTIHPTPTSSIYSCPHIDHYICDNGQCINISSICDGAKDCSDSSDEGGDCAIACSPELERQCTSICYKSPRGPECLCPSGYELVQRICSDINECQSRVNQCEQSCVNTDGSYDCGCNEGYVLEQKYKCKAEGKPPAYIVATRNDFRVFTYRQIQHYDVVPLTFINTKTPKIIRPTYFAVRGDHQFYWVDNQSHRLYVTNTESGNTTLLTHSIPTILALRWDWGGKKIYWVTDKKSIEIVTKDGQFSRAIVSHGDKINGLVLNPLQSTLVFSSVSVNGTGKLNICGLDGKKCRVFAEKTDDIFRTLTIDYVENTLYWVSHRDNKIEKSPLLEYKRKVVYQYKGAKIITGLSVFEYRVSWIESDLSRDEVDGGGSIQIKAQRANDRLSTVYYRRENDHEVFSRLAMRQIPVSAQLGVLQKWFQPPIESNLCELFPCTFFCWSQSANFCTCPRKKLHSMTTTPEHRYRFCQLLDTCPTPPLSQRMTPLRIQSMNARAGGEAMVTCDDQERVHQLICKADGTWSEAPRCQNDYRACSSPNFGNGTVSVLSNPNAITTLHAYWEGARVYVTCVEGFRIRTGQDNMTLKCGRDGRWNKPIPDCDKIKIIKEAVDSNHRIIPLIVIIAVVVTIVLILSIWWIRKNDACMHFRKRGTYSTQLMSPTMATTAELGYTNPLSVAYTNNGTENGSATIGITEPKST